MKNILIHGLGQDPSSWDQVKAYLKDEKFNTICPTLFDLAQNDTYSYFNVYRNFEKQTNKYDEKVNLCGLSLGGILALDYAKKYPEKINSLILIGVPYKIPRLLFNIQTFIFKLMPRSKFTKLGLIKEQFINLVKSVKNLEIDEGLDKINCKTLLICGKKDKINIKSSKLFKKNIKNSKFQIIENAGHEVNIDNPKDLSKLIADFWNKK